MRKIAIITGASSGIGGATAVALAERSVDSIVTFNSHEDRVRDVVEAVRQRGAKALPLRLDVGEIVLYARAGKVDDPDRQHFQHGVVALERHLRHLAAG